MGGWLQPVLKIDLLALVPCPHCGLKAIQRHWHVCPELNDWDEDDATDN